MINEIINKIDIVKKLENYYILFGILDEDKYQEINIDILNPDDTVSNAILPVKDVMYLTEAGTVTLPGKHILERLVFEIDYQINKIINEIIDNVFNDNWNDNEIDSKMQQLERHLQDFIRSRIRGEISTSGISALLGIKDDKEYLYHIDQLMQYIKCKVKKK